MEFATDRTIKVQEILHDDKWVKEEIVDVLFNNGKEIRNFLRITSKSGGYIMIIARLVDGRFILTRQCRPVAGMSVEGVAGGREYGEGWIAAGLREMNEEIGYKPNKLVSLGVHFYPLTDRCDNPCHIFLAMDCVPVENRVKGDEVQGLEAVLVSKKEVLEMIADGRIKDLATLAGILGHLAIEGGQLSE